MSKVSELCAMYGPPGTKPAPAPKSVAGRWNPKPSGGSDNSNQSSQPAALKPNSFLHSAQKPNTAPWAQKNQANVSNSSAPVPKRPWEQKKPDTEPKNRFSGGLSNANAENKPDRPWQSNTGVNKTPSFNKTGVKTTSPFNNSGTNKTSAFNSTGVKKTPSFKSPAINRDKPENSIANGNDNIPAWKKNLRTNKTESVSTLLSSTANQPSLNEHQETTTKPSWVGNQRKSEDEEAKNEINTHKPTRNTSFLDRAKAINNIHNQHTSDQASSGTLSGHKKFEGIKSNDVTEKNKFSSSAGFAAAKNKFGSADTPPPPPPQKPTANSQLLGTNAKVPRRKRSLPEDVYRRPAPAKPRKPSHANLPGDRGLPAAPSPLHDGPDSFPPQRNRSFMTKHAQGRTGVAGSPKPPPPATPSSNFLSTGADNDSLFPSPPSPSKLRNLPPTPNQPPSVSDDIYDDTTDIPPPPLPSMPFHARAPPVDENCAEIPTWDDEDDQDVYDETPDAGGYPPPQIPEEDGDDFYEDLDQYSKFKGQPPNVLPKDDKPKKEIDKKEKQMRKKYSLPLDGEIFSEATGFLRCDVKGFHKSTLHANDKVDVIRMSNNPKGKWLIRTENGTYGYIEPDKVNTDPYAMRQQPPLPPAQFKAPNLPSHLPGNLPPPLPGNKPGVDDEPEGIYDEAPEPDELYESL